jgi:hypothetical protein
MSTAVTPPTVLQNSVPIVPTNPTSAATAPATSSPPYMSFIFLMLLLIGIFAGLESLSNISQISTNWPEVRCQPQNILLAGLYGHDANENYQFCLQQIIQDKTKSSTAPFAQGMGGFTSVLQNLMSSANSFRTTLATMAGGIIKIISEFKSRMTALMGRVKLTASRMKAMMYRVYGTMFAVMYMGISAQTGIANFGDTFIFKFIDAFCFAPDTRVILADGSDKIIKELRLGDKLAGTCVVEAIIQCPGSSDIYSIYGVSVSGRHRIWSSEQAKFICVKDHPDAVRAAAEPSLWTLVTSNREIPVKGSNGLVRFADWEELPSTQKALKEWDTIVQIILNKTVEDISAPKSAPCLDKAILVYKYQAGFTPLYSIKVGDWILDSYAWTKVVGICNRRVQTSIGSYGSRITDGLWIEGTTWTHPSGKINEGAWDGYQLITTSGTFTIYNNQKKYRVRDFTEVGTERLVESFKMEDEIHES